MNQFNFLLQRTRVKSYSDLKKIALENILLKKAKKTSCRDIKEEQNQLMASLMELRRQ